MMIGQLGWEEIDLIRALKYLVTMLTLGPYVNLCTFSSLVLYVAPRLCLNFYRAESLSLVPIIFAISKVNARFQSHVRSNSRPRIQLTIIVSTKSKLLQIHKVFMSYIDDNKLLMMNLIICQSTD